MLKSISANDSTKHLFHCTILTLFPEIFPSLLELSLAGRALKNKIWSYNAINLRDFGITKHKKVDDTPCGGGNGLIMRPDVLGNALDFAKKSMPSATKIYYPSPRGKRLNQSIVKELREEKNIIILCGRFEGIDERVIEEFNITEISIGDYVLSGGELASLVILDCIIRTLPGVLANNETIESESFSDIEGIKGILEYPLYTKPIEWRGRKVPEELLSGHHNKIKKWRQENALKLTKKRRPDLL